MNPAAEPVVKKVLKPKDVAAVGGPMYGAFEYRGRVVQLQPDTNLRDNEDVPLTAETARGANVDAVNEAYFKKEVAPHVEDAWIDRGERDVRDGQVGVVGYEISFTRQFSEFMKFRNKSNLIKLKSCIARNPKGRHAWNALRRRFTLPESGDPLKLYDSETRVDVREDLLDVDYFNYFLETDEAGDWLVYAANDGSATHRYHLPIGRNWSPALG